MCFGPFEKFSDSRGKIFIGVKSEQVFLSKVPGTQEIQHGGSFGMAAFLSFPCVLV